MILRRQQYADEEEIQKAGYNQAGAIAEVLGNLMKGYIVHLNRDEYGNAFKCITRIADIISPKLKPSELQEIDNLIQIIELNLEKAEKKHRTDFGWIVASYPKIREEIRKKIIELFRIINKMQDVHGYGMIELGDPRLAVAQMG